MCRGGELRLGKAARESRAANLLAYFCELRAHGD
jgi:hypothetical protein